MSLAFKATDDNVERPALHPARTSLRWWKILMYPNWKQRFPHTSMQCFTLMLNLSEKIDWTLNIKVKHCISKQTYCALSLLNKQWNKGKERDRQEGGWDQRMTRSQCCQWLDWDRQYNKCGAGSRHLTVSNRTTRPSAMDTRWDGTIGEYVCVIVYL